MADIVTKIGYAMSLRNPQQEALSYLDAISTHCDYKKDSKTAIEAVATEYCEKQRKPLRYYVYGTDKYNRLMNYYGQSCKDTEKATLSSMREVENAANMFYYTEE